MSERFERRIRELRAMPLDDGEFPISNESIAAARLFLHEPLVTATPNGDIALDWRWPDGASLSLRFREGPSPNWAGRPIRSPKDTKASGT